MHYYMNKNKFIISPCFLGIADCDVQAQINLMHLGSDKQKLAQYAN